MAARGEWRHEVLRQHIPSITDDDRSRSNKIFVGGLPHSCMEEELEGYFSQFGLVAASSVVKDRDTGRARGFGFVIFRNIRSVDAVMSQHDNHQISGKWIDCKRAIPHRQMPPGKSMKGSSKSSKGYDFFTDDVQGNYGRPSDFSDEKLGVQKPRRNGRGGNAEVSVMTFAPWEGDEVQTYAAVQVGRFADGDAFASPDNEEVLSVPAATRNVRCCLRITEEFDDYELDAISSYAVCHMHPYDAIWAEEYDDGELDVLASTDSAGSASSPRLAAPELGDTEYPWWPSPVVEVAPGPALQGAKKRFQIRNRQLNCEPGARRGRSEAELASA